MAKVRVEDFRSAAQGRALQGLFRVQAITDAGTGASGPPPALVGESLVTRVVSRRVMAGADIERGTLEKPESITARTPSMVRLVSAMDVASTTFRAPSGEGRMASSWARLGNRPYKGTTLTSFPVCLSSSLCRAWRISPAPGRKTRMSPRRFPQRGRNRFGDAGSHGESQILGGVHGIDRMHLPPRLRQTGASFKVPRRLSESRVADMTRMRRSGRSAPRTSRHSARPVSAWMLLSWNSSNTTSATSSNSGSLWIRLVNMPSVTASTRVRGPILESMRTR